MGRACRSRVASRGPPRPRSAALPPWRRCVVGREVPPSLAARRPRSEGRGRVAVRVPASRRDCRVAASRRVCPGCLVARSPAPAVGAPSSAGRGPRAPSTAPRSLCSRRPRARALAVRLAAVGRSGPPCRRRAWFRRAAAFPPPARRPCAARGSARTHVYCALAPLALARFLPRSAHVRPLSEETAPRWRALPAHRALLPG